MNNPPVNALGHPVREGLVEALSVARADPAVKAIIIAAEGKLFSAGADISEFDKTPMPPMLSEVIAALAGTGKPTVAAIHGSAFGGGLELALGCQARVATRDAK